MFIASAPDLQRAHAFALVIITVAHMLNGSIELTRIDRFFKT